MFSLTQFMLSYNISQETLIIFLMLPVIATVIALARQVIGIQGFGIYTPMIISVVFLMSGLGSGLLFFLIILLMGTVTRLLINKLRLRLLYLPRMAIIICAVVLFVLFFIWLSAYLNLSGLGQTPVFAILIMIALVEKFLISQIQRPKKESLILTLETLLLSTICYYLVSWHWFQDITLAYPLGVIAAVLVINFVLGRWTGLRLYEYYRFRKIINRVELPDKK